MNKRQRKKNNMPLGIFVAPDCTTQEEHARMARQLQQAFNGRFILMNEPIKFIPIKRNPKIKLFKCQK